MKKNELAGTGDSIKKETVGDTLKMTFSKDGKPAVTLTLCQPVRKDKTGIWVVTAWTDEATGETHAVTK